MSGRYEGAFLPFCIDVLTLNGDRIAEVTAFVFRDFGLPARVT